MKTREEIQNEVARNYGENSWEELIDFYSAGAKEGTQFILERINEVIQLCQLETCNKIRDYLQMSSDIQYDINEMNFKDFIK